MQHAFALRPRPARRRRPALTITSGLLDGPRHAIAFARAAPSHAGDAAGFPSTRRGSPSYRMWHRRVAAGRSARCEFGGRRAFAHPREGLQHVLAGAECVLAEVAAGTEGFAALRARAGRPGTTCRTARFSPDNHPTGSRSFRSGSPSSSPRVTVFRARPARVFPALPNRASPAAPALHPAAARRARASPFHQAAT